MANCNICVHKAVCDLWCEQESQTAECYSTDGNKCSYFHQDNKWIPVSERLPEDGYAVLVTCGKGYRPFIARYDHVWKRWKVSHTLRITHWMPLPEPPKEVER